MAGAVDDFRHTDAIAQLSEFPCACYGGATQEARLSLAEQNRVEVLVQWIAGMRAIRVILVAALAAIIIVPRVYRWGSVPVAVHGDEAGFSAVGDDEYADPSPPWTFGPNGLPRVHYWVIGFSRQFWANRYSVWPGRAVTALFGFAQVLAVVAIAFQVAGMAGALTAAVVMAHPLPISFERTVWCQFWTTGCWSLALWCVMRWPFSRPAAIAAGVLGAAGFYAYQASRIAPVIAAAGLLTVLATTPAVKRRAALGVMFCGLAAFAVTVAAFAYGVWLSPGAYSVRIYSTSWLGGPTSSWAFGWQRFCETARALTDGRVVPGLPYALPFAALGLCATGNAALSVTLAVWIVLVMIGNALRTQTLYAEVLVCLMPAMALAIACVVRLPGLRRVAVLVPMAVTWMTWGQLPTYFASAAAFHGDQEVTALFARFVAAQPATARFLFAGVGCGHGTSQLAVHHRPCADIGELPAGPLPPQTVVIAFPPLASSIAAVCRERQLPVAALQWAGTPVVVCGPGLMNGTAGRDG